MTTVFRGRIRPLSPVTDAEAEAMAVEDGRIVAVGTADELIARFPDAETVALDGWVMPGLIEPHGHPAYSSILLSDLVVRHPSRHDPRRGRGARGAQGGGGGCCR